MIITEKKKCLRGKIFLIIENGERLFKDSSLVERLRKTEFDPDSQSYRRNLEVNPQSTN